MLNKYNVNKKATFQISSEVGRKFKKLLRAFATSPSQAEHEVEVVEEEGRFVANFVPTETGIWQIVIEVNGRPIKGCPFNVKVDEVTQVKVIFKDRNVVGRLVDFKVEVAGCSGHDINISIFHDDVIVNPRIQRYSIDEDTEVFHVEFSPNGSGIHLVNVTVDGKNVEGTPFELMVNDADDVIVTGRGLLEGWVGEVVEIFIDVGLNGVAQQLRVFVQDAVGGGQVETKLRDNRNGTVTCSYLPVDEAKFEGMKVDNLARVTVKNFNFILGKHSVHVIYFNKVYKTSQRNNNINNNININNININNNNIININIGPTQRQKLNYWCYSTTYHTHTPGLYRVNVVPNQIGKYKIEVMTPSRDVIITRDLFVYNVAAIVVSPVSMATVGETVKMRVDLSKAGQGQMEVKVNGGKVMNRVEKVGHHVFVVSFVPTEDVVHVVEVRFNGESLPRLITIPVNAPTNNNRPIKSQDTSKRETYISTSANQSSTFKIKNWTNLKTNKLTAIVQSPSGEVVPCKLVRQPDDDVSVHFKSPYTGKHKVNIYNDDVLMSALSPFYVEVFDPSLIRIISPHDAEVNTIVRIEISTLGAGQANMQTNILGPSNEQVGHEVLKTSNGFSVLYTPHCTGIFRIFVYYGGILVPGCPIKQMITNTDDIETNGDGLKGGIEGHLMKFMINTKGHPGQLKVVVEGQIFTNFNIAYASAMLDFFKYFKLHQQTQTKGPNSLARTQIYEESKNQYLVNFTPEEVGFFKVSVLCNNSHVTGSPFKVNVWNAEKVKVHGGWPLLLSDTTTSQSNHDVSSINNIFKHSSNDISKDDNLYYNDKKAGELELLKDEMRRFVLNVNEAGYGRLKANVRNKHGEVPVEIVKVGEGLLQVSFTPRIEGLFVHVD
ncbi:hypothetical protein HELRODRAFT_194487 [Helobdella robusta]|uniref:Uncharacterized protein n=1 Tax=Helobdella robusta TaxID=6412 RepID=T1FW42_HELRO|nr:hypothetical protein HELRODRAFT_194487 [Helobdella robusta]ESN91940.1 hypothetical protein HELRODRAFT_194487 [Helobdella robusta]